MNTTTNDASEPVARPVDQRVRPLALLLAGLLAACTPNAKDTKPDDAQKLVDALRFAKHANGLCFGVATTSRLSFRGDVAENVVIVAVDCKAAGL